MSRGKTNKLYRTFTKGLITEAGFLTYPENASTDELNTVIKKKGSRSRRFGIEYEPSSTSVDLGLTDNEVVSEFYWKAVGNKSNTNFLVIQTGHNLHFFDTSVTPISAGKKSFTLFELLSYKSSGSTDADVTNNPCQMASGKGFLFVAHPFLDPFVIEYLPDTDTILSTKIILQIRDFDGLNDDLANDEEPTTLSKEHYYNLKNQGWVLPGRLGVLEGAGSTNPNTAPPPPTDSGSYGGYNPWTGNPHEQEP